MSYRNLVAHVLRKKLPLLDSINNSVEFYDYCSNTLGPTPEFANRMALHEHVAEPLRDGAMTYLEFGVWKGESLRKWVGLNSHPDSRFVGFDTFTGLPEDWEAGHPKGSFSTGGRAPEIGDPRATFEIGLFQSTLRPYLERNPISHPLVVHVDCDLYSSTLFVLSVLDPEFGRGTVLIFDDFHSLNHEFAAWCDYCRAFTHHVWEPIGKTRSCVQAAVRLRETR